MKISILSLVVLLFLNSSCRDKTIKAEGIEDFGVHLSSLKQNNKLWTFLGGEFGRSIKVTSSKGNSLTWQKSYARLYVSKDNNKSFKVYSFGRGYINDTKFIDNKVFVFKLSEDFNTYSVFSFTNDKVWKHETGFPQDVRDLFYIKGQYVAIVDSENIHHSLIYTSENKGKTWKVRDSTLSIQNPFIKNGFMYFLSSEEGDNDARKKIIGKYDFSSFTCKTYDLPVNFESDFLTYNDKRINIIGKLNKHIAIFNMGNDNKFRLHYLDSENLNWSPDAAYNYKNSDWLLIGKIEGFSVAHRLLNISNGKTIKEKIEFSSLTPMNDYYFMRRNNKVSFVTHSYGGHFQQFDF